MLYANLAATSWGWATRTLSSGEGGGRRPSSWRTTSERQLRIGRDDLRARRARAKRIRDGRLPPFAVISPHPGGHPLRAAARMSELDRLAATHGIEIGYLT